MTVQGPRHRIRNLSLLLTPADSEHGRQPRLIDPIDNLTIEYVRAAEAEVGDPLAALAPFGFKFDIGGEGFMFRAFRPEPSA